MEKVKYIKVGQTPKRRRVRLRTWLARLNGWAVARYAFLTVAGILLYKLGAVYALRERGYPSGPCISISMTGYLCG